MKRSLQEVVELVVFGLIALLIGTGVLWLVGWVLGLVGLLLKFLAGLIWWLLRFIVPVAIVAGLIYFLVRVLQGDRSAKTVTPPSPVSATSPATVGPSPSVVGEGPAGEAASRNEPTDEPAPADEGPTATDEPPDSEDKGP